MIVCPQCHHQNADALSHCEACFSELPTEPSCSNCGQKYRPESKFCGHCGATIGSISLDETFIAPGNRPDKIPELSPPDPIIEVTPVRFPVPHSDEILANSPGESLNSVVQLAKRNGFKPHKDVCAALVHESTQFKVQLDAFESPIHLGKPNRKVMPDINLATFKHSEIVSRIHADILVEGDQFFIQDKGSANGTFLNHRRIHPEHRHRLTSGDKIALGKGNLVTFIFELS